MLQNDGTFCSKAPWHAHDWDVRTRQVQETIYNEFWAPFEASRGWDVSVILLVLWSCDNAIFYLTFFLVEIQIRI